MAYTDLLQRRGGGDASALLRAYEAAVQKQYDARQQAAQNGAGGDTSSVSASGGDTFTSRGRLGANGNGGTGSSGAASPRASHYSMQPDRVGPGKTPASTEDRLFAEYLSYLDQSKAGVGRSPEELYKDYRKGVDDYYAAYDTGAAQKRVDELTAENHPSRANVVKTGRSRASAAEKEAARSERDAVVENNRAEAENLLNDIERANSVKADRDAEAAMSALQESNPAAYQAVSRIADLSQKRQFAATATYRDTLKSAGYTDAQIRELVEQRTRLLNRETYERESKQLSDLAQSGLLGGAAATGIRIATGLPVGVAGALDLTVQRLSGKPVDWYSPNLSAQRMEGDIVQAVAGELEQNTDWEIAGQNVAAFLYQTGISMTDSAAIAGMTALGVPAWLGTAALGTTAGTQAAIDAHERGASDRQAFNTGLMAGIAEAVFEKISLDTLLKPGAVNGATMGKRVMQTLRNLGVQAVTEGSEEVFTDLANGISDAWINGGQSEFQQNVRRYQLAGLNDEEAHRAAARDFAVQLGSSFAGGALSGGIMSGATQGIQTGNADRQARRIYGTEAQALVDEALEIDPNNKAAQRAKEKLAQGKALSGGELRLIVAQNDAAIAAAEEQTLTDAHTGDATGTGDTSSARSAGTFPSRGRLADGVQPSTQGEGGQNAPPLNRAARIGAAEGNSTAGEENAVTGQETAPTASFSDPLTRAIFGEPAANKNAASQEATSAAYYDPMMAAAIRREGKTFRNLVAGVDTSVSDFFSKWKRGRNTTNGDKLEKLYLAQMPENVRQRVADILGYDVGNRDFIFTNENAKHIFDEHGDADAEIRKGNIPLDPWVLDALPEVLTSPDSVAPGHLDKKGDRLGVVFTKAMPNGVVVTVQFDNKGRGTMEARTVYAKEGGSTPSVSRPSSDEESSTIRPRRPEPVLPSTDATIAQPSEIVKSGNTAEGITADGVNMPGELGNTVGAAEGGFTGGPSVMEQMADYNGEMEPGERPAVRYGAIPVTTDGEDRVSQTARTAYEAAATPDDFIPEMENAIVEGDFSYLPTTNDETTRDARVWIMDRGWSRAVADWQSDVKSGKVNARTAAIGALLYNNAVNAGDHKEAMRILTLYAASQRNAAQALQASRILKRLSPEMKLYGILQTVEGFMEEAGINPADGITISEELQQRFMDAQTEEERNDVIGEMQQEVADQLPVTMLDKWNALRYVNMLGNFKTQVRNVGGNVVMQALTGAKNVTLTALETLASKASGGTYERRTALAPGKARMDAARADFDHVRDVAMGESRYSLTGGQNADASGFMRGAMEKRRIFKFMPLEAYRKATNWLMEKGDEIFAQNSYARALAGWLKAHGVTAEQFNDSRWQAEHADEMDRARAFAIKEAQEATFRDTNAFSDWVSRLGRKSTTPKVGRIAAEGILPFRKTPANVAVRAVEYSPLGIVEAAVNAARKGLAQTNLATKSGAIASGANVTGADVMNQLAKGLTGTGLFALGMMLRNMGLLKAGDDRDKDQAAFDDMTGQQPFALTLPDGTSYTLDWLTPAAIPLFMGATLADNMDEDGRFTFADVSDALAQIGEPMLQMSMLQGVNDLLGNVRYSDNRLVQTALQSMVGYLTQGLTNTMLGQLERTVETERMSTYADKNSPVFPSWLQREIGRASAKIPGVDYHQYPYINAWGETESTGDPGTRALVNFLSPGYVSKVELSPVEQELRRLARATGKTSIYPDVAPKYFTVNGETKQLTMDEYVRYATQRGQESRRLVTALTEARQYEGLDDETKKKLIEKAYEYANAKAKAEVSDYAPAQSSWLNKAYAAERAGIPIEDYILLRFTADTNANGSVSKAEAQAATETSSLNGQQKDALMQILFP